ncbi:hypothetical protein ASA1KI_29580 [Opitutales bacterium ASA1]|nr:hypothetical protein ASA1KI_29580 [Opitutales bacterium ASA1]
MPLATPAVAARVTTSTTLELGNAANTTITPASPNQFHTSIAPAPQRHPIRGSSSQPPTLACPTPPRSIVAFRNRSVTSTLAFHILRLPLP